MDGKKVSRISAYLNSGEIDSSPYVLRENLNKSFQGCIFLGKRFIFEDSNDPEISSIITMNEIIAAETSASEIIRPYIGGEQVNNLIKLQAERYAVFIQDQNEDQVKAKHPLIYNYLESVLKEERKSQKRQQLRERWWMFAESRPALFSAIAPFDRVIVTSRVGAQRFFTFLPTSIVYDQSLLVFSSNCYGLFAFLQSTVHYTWNFLTCSSMKDDLRYNGTDCFETFPFPKNHEIQQPLKDLGRDYYLFRSWLTRKEKEGLTKIYNRFHDPDETSLKIKRLRDIHQKIDQAVLDAYGWNDLILKYDFILDYEEDEDGESSSRKKKKPYRYKFVPELHDEILARLLRLNQERHEEEVRLGLQK